MSLLYSRTVGEWVRGALRAAGQQRPVRSAESKPRALAEAARHNFPAPDIEQLRAETERGYLKE